MSLTKLHAVLKELEKKYNATYCDLPLDQLYELKKEMERLKEEIYLEEEKEKYLKAVLEQECEDYDYKQADYRMASSVASIRDFPQKPIKKSRIVPVDDEGEPIQSLGGGKWVRK